MHTNATLLEIYARARRDEDLLPRRFRSSRPRFSLRGLLRRLAPRTTPAPVPPVRVQPRQQSR